MEQGYFAIFSFFIIGYILSIYNFDLIESIILFSFGNISAILITKNIEQNKNKIKPKKATVYTVTCRVLFIIFSILLITEVSNFIGVKWSGIMASFPVGLFPILITLSYFYDDKIYPTVIKNFSYSISTLLIFYLSSFYLITLTNLYLGLLVSYIICFIYLYIISKIIKYLE